MKCARIAVLGLALLPITVLAQAKFDGQLCCNMRTDGSWITDGNYDAPGNRIIPAGTPVKITGYGRQRVRVEIDGGKQAIGNDYSRDLDLETFARRYVVQDDVRARIASWPAGVQEVVAAAKATPGMTREQVLVSLGYPMSSENPDLDAGMWRYWLDSFSEFQIHFDSEGRVRDIVAEATIRSRVWVP